MEQGPDLVGLEQPGDAEEVHLLLGADVDLAGVAERRPVEEHMVEPGLRAQRLERAEQVVGGRLPRLRAGEQRGLGGHQVVLGVDAAAEHVVALTRSSSAA